MEHLSIFEMSTDELMQTVSCARLRLKEENPEYERLRNEVVKIVKQYPNLDNIYDTKSTLELTKEECKMLQKMMELKLKIKEYEESEFLIEGALRTYLNLQEQAMNCNSRHNSRMGQLPNPTKAKRKENFNEKKTYKKAILVR